MDRIKARLNGLGSLTAALAGKSQMAAKLQALDAIETPPFTGDYEYTPTNAEQTIEIGGLRAVSNITINPIPQNYGLISWNGSIITVS